MKRLLMLMIAAVLWGAPVLAFSATGPDAVKSFVAGSLDVSAVAKSMTVFAYYEAEEQATKAMRERITELGYTLATRPEDANIVFKVSKTYYGKAADRPKVGEYDGESTANGFSFASLLGWVAVGAATGSVPSAADSIVSSGLKGGFWTQALRSTGAITEIEQAFKPTKKPQEAVVSHIEMTVNGNSQTADVVSESYAEGLPRDAIMAENLRQAVWYLE